MLILFLSVQREDLREHLQLPEEREVRLRVINPHIVVTLEEQEEVEVVQEILEAEEGAEHQFLVQEEMEERDKEQLLVLEEEEEVQEQ